MIRLLALALSATLLVSGCGSSDRKTSERDGKPTATAESRDVIVGESPGPKNPGATPTAATPAPGSGTYSGTPAPVADDPVAVLRAILDAVDAENYVTQRALTSDAAHAIFRVREIISLENARRGAKTENTVTYSRQPKLESADANRAVISFEATIKSVVSGEKGTLPSEDTAGGPAVLLRTDGRWRLADFSYSGAPLSAGWQPQADSVDTKNGFALRVSGVLSYKSTTSVLMSLESDGQKAPLRLSPAELAQSDDPQNVKQRQFGFEGGDSSEGFFGFGRVKGRATKLIVKAKRTDTETEWTWEVPLT